MAHLIHAWYDCCEAIHQFYCYDKLSEKQTIILLACQAMIVIYPSRILLLHLCKADQYPCKQSLTVENICSARQILVFHYNGYKASMVLGIMNMDQMINQFS